MYIYFTVSLGANTLFLFTYFHVHDSAKYCGTPFYIDIVLMLFFVLNAILNQWLKITKYISNWILRSNVNSLWPSYA